MIFQQIFHVNLSKTDQSLTDHLAATAMEVAGNPEKSYGPYSDCEFPFRSKRLIEDGMLD